MDWLLPAIVAALTSSIIIAFIFCYLYIQEKEKCLFIWSIGWAFYTLRFSFSLVKIYVPESHLVFIGEGLSTLISGYFLLMGSYAWRHNPLPNYWAFLTGICAIWNVFGVVGHFSFSLITALIFLFVGLIFIKTGVNFLLSPRVEGLGQKLSGWVFIFWGIHKWDYPFLRPISWIAPWGFLLGVVFGILVGLGLLLIYFERVRKYLSESENRYRSIFENNHAAMLLVDPQTGQIVDANPAACQFYGYSHQQLSSMPIRQLNVLSPEAIAAEMEQARTMSKTAFSFRHQLANGEMRDVEVNSGRINVHGKDLLYSLIFDVTQRKRLEKSLMESEERLRRALLFAPFPIVIISKPGNILFVNQIFTEITGYTQSEIPTIENWVAKAYGEEKREEIIQGIQKLYDLQRRVDEGEFVITTKTGESRFWEFSSAPLGLGSDGNPMIISIAKDNTERYRLEKEASAQKEILSSILDNAPVMAAFLSPEGRYRWINPHWEATLGWSLNEIQDFDVWDEFYPNPDDRNKALEFTKKAEKKWGEFKIHRRDGHVLDTLWMNIRLEDHSTIGIGLDITEQKLLEEQLRQSQKMESVGRLAGGVAHDFNNLLMAIMGYTEMCLHNTDPSSSLHEDMQQVQKAADRAVSLTRQLLAFSRKQILQTEILDLNKLILNLDKMLRRMIGEDIEYITLPYSGLWKVNADPAQIEQIIINLAVNARDAMPNGGKLVIETQNVELSEEYVKSHFEMKPGNFVMVAVSDTGCGIPHEIADKIFEPFFTTKGVGKGTGLGLSTVHGIVKQSGGGIFVYSELGKGTTFKIYLPQQIEGGETEHWDNSSQCSSGTETILLVEDEDLVRRLVKRTLEDQGYKILVANYGSQAIEVATHYPEKIHLLLTDVIMPKMSGKELSTILTEQRPDMKVLYMSGYTNNAIVHHGILDGGIQFLQKPFTSDMLLRKVRTLLEG